MVRYGRQISLALSAGCAHAFFQDSSLEHNANPVRKVVTMLQNMQKKVSAEGEKEKELFEKFMCYCKNADSELQKAIDDADAKIPQVASQIKETEAAKVQLEADLKKHQSDRAAAKDAMAKASAIREKESAAYAAEKADYDANIAAVTKAVNAIENGMSGSFLQTQAAQAIKKLALNGDMNDGDRKEIMAFFTESSDSDYAPSSGEITGILKTMKEEMEANLKSATDSENAAVSSYDELMAAKKKEVESLTKAIETKMPRVGEMGVEIEMMKQDLSETQEQAIEDKKFLQDIDKTCKTKEDEYAARLKTRGEEITALAETIKILNDDDALEMFKKTLPGASASFVQVGVNTRETREHVSSIMEEMRRSDSSHQHLIDFILLALQGKAKGFEKVIKMIDGMLAVMKKEQQDDDDEKEYCEKQFDIAEDKKKGLETDLSNLETSIDDAKEGIARLAEEIEALDDGIKALDKSVEDATEQRQQEAKEYTELMAADTTAKELLEFAKNRLNKFYNPSQYKPPPKRELSEDERITLNMGGTLAPTEAPGGIAGTGIGFVQISEHSQKMSAPPPPPETWEGGYSKKSEESSGVIAMIDLLVKDLDKEMTIAERDEKDAQEGYERMMKDSAEKRVEDSKALTQKTKARAELKTDLETANTDEYNTKKELMATEEYIGSLHGQCDWLLKYYDMRKQSRAEESENLNKAKAVLNGADFSFLQTKISTFLSRA